MRFVDDAESQCAQIATTMLKSFLRDQIPIAQNPHAQNVLKK
jgi:hypothetical protein